MHIFAFRGHDLYISKAYFNGESAYLIRVGKEFCVISASEFMLKMNELEEQ
jgi:hypothetical protein